MAALSDVAGRPGGEVIGDLTKLTQRQARPAGDPARERGRRPLRSMRSDTG